MEKFNISKPEKYIDKSGTEKTFWNNVGKMTIFTRQDGTKSTIIEIPAIGLKANVFPIQEKNSQEYNQSNNYKKIDNKPVEEIGTIEYPEEEINASDIPF